MDIYPDICPDKTISAILIPHSRQVLNNLRIPRDHLRKLVAWELAAQATEPGIMFFAAGMHLAHPRPGPLRNSPIRLDTSGAGSIFLFRTSNTALATGCDSSKISHT
jgi:hypothetical protein